MKITPAPTHKKTRKPSLHLAKKADTPAGESYAGTVLSEEPSQKAWVVVGKSVSEGAIVGIAMKATNQIAYQVGGPVAGGLVTAAMTVAGAAYGVHAFGDRASELTGSKTFGKAIAATTGAGMAFMTTAVGGPDSSLAMAVVSGGAMGGLYGLITAPGKA